MIGELALALALLELVALAAVVVAGVLVWRKVAPTVAPLLAMFAPAQPMPSMCGFVDPAGGGGCEYAAGHDGSHGYVQ